jgi:hypothetical protein
VLFDEQQVRDDDVGRGDIGLGAGERGGVLGPFGGGVDRNRDAREVLGQPSATRAAGPAAWASSVTITTR